MTEATAGLVVDLAAIAANWQQLAAAVAPAACGAVVKADAYGLGAAEIAPALLAAGCRHFFVATLDEGLALRPLLPEADIIVMHGIVPGRMQEYVAASLIPVLNTLRDVEQWRGQTGSCWLQVDTGINRQGFGLDELPDLSGFTLACVMSHLACADELDHFMNVEQLRKFRALRQRFPGLPGSFANSGGVFLGKPYHADIVRPGIALYGGFGLRPVVSLHAPVLQVRDIAAGECVGYGALWQADRPTKLATIEAGYSEGLHRALFGRGQAFINGTKVPMIGRISMDLITLDVTGAGDVQPGMLAEILGPHQSADQLGEASGTINYEILTSLSPRAGRRYFR